ncbi:MAG: ABC transporter permease subunit [Clostridia bacterium]
MKNILVIIKKEFTRFFCDRRLVLTTLILPALLIFAMYSLIGGAMDREFEVSKDYVYQVYSCNTPESVSNIVTLNKIKIKFVDIGEYTIEQAKEKLVNKTLDLVIVFPQDFDNLVKDYDITNPQAIAPNINMFYNSTRTESYTAYSMFSGIFNSYEAMLANKFDINKGNPSADLATKKDTTGKFFASLLPMLMMSFLFSGCMAIAPESIAGEKERGTIATLLVTPLKRSHLAVGKIISLSVIALLSGISSFLGTVLSLPKMIHGAGDGASQYVFGDYAMLFMVILSTVLLLTALISVISAYSNSVKQASALVTPIMILSMLLGLTTMFSDGAVTNLWLYLIPLYNSVQTMNGIFLFTPNYLAVTFTVVINILLAVGLSALLAYMFKQEKFMFAK